jgi:RNA recognition motif-containing protein
MMDKVVGFSKHFHIYKEIKMDIYVGNLSLNVTEDDLKTTFEVYGKVETVKVIKDKYIGTSKGFGFIEMPDNSEAQSAIAGLNNKEFKGKTLTVNTARPRTENRRGSGGYGSGGGKGGRQGHGGRRW